MLMFFNRVAEGLGARFSGTALACHTQGHSRVGEGSNAGDGRTKKASSRRSRNTGQRSALVRDKEKEVEGSEDKRLMWPLPVNDMTESEEERYK